MKSCPRCKSTRLEIIGSKYLCKDCGEELIEYLSEREFKEFKENDFHNLKKEVRVLNNTVTFIRGQLYILIPLVIAILAITIGLLIK